MSDNKNLYVKKEDFNSIMDYLVNNIGPFYNAKITLPNGKIIKAQPYGDKVEINCEDPEIKNKLEEMTDKNGN